MNTFFVKTLRIMMLFLFIISLALGYVIYEDTLAVWWIPVGVALLIALATLPFYRKWSWLTTTEGKVMNVLCHIGCVGAISYALFLSGNYWLADTASIYEETVMVQKKYIETHKKTRRVGKHRYVSNGVRKEYYLQVAFENGNVDACALQLGRMLNSPDSVLKMGCNARKHVEKHYSFSNNIDQFIKGYESLVMHKKRK